MLGTKVRSSVGEVCALTHGALSDPRLVKFSFRSAGGGGWWALCVLWTATPSLGLSSVLRVLVHCGHMHKRLHAQTQAPGILQRQGKSPPSTTTTKDCGTTRLPFPSRCLEMAVHPHYRQRRLESTGHFRIRLYLSSTGRFVSSECKPVRKTAFCLCPLGQSPHETKRDSPFSLWDASISAP